MTTVVYKKFFNNLLKESVVKVKKFSDLSTDEVAKLLAEANFLTMPEDQLLELINLATNSMTGMAHMADIVKKAEMEKRFIGQKLVEIRWEYYDELVVTNDEITYMPEHGSPEVIFTSQKYAMYKFFFKQADMYIPEDKVLFEFRNDYPPEEAYKRPSLGS